MYKKPPEVLQVLQHAWHVLRVALKTPVVVTLPRHSLLVRWGRECRRACWNVDPLLQAERDAKLARHAAPDEKAVPEGDVDCKQQ
eukprot:6186326-Pleurochrysis_carterae.AAC.2